MEIISIVSICLYITAQKFLSNLSVYSKVLICGPFVHECMKIYCMQQVHMRELPTIMVGGGGWKGGAWNILENLGGVHIVWRFIGGTANIFGDILPQNCVILRHSFPIVERKIVHTFEGGRKTFLHVWGGWEFFLPSRNISTYTPYLGNNCWQLLMIYIQMTKSILCMV